MQIDLLVVGVFNFLYTNDGDGTFTVVSKGGDGAISHSCCGDFFSWEAMISASFGDFDGDGKMDILAVPRDDAQIALMRNTGGGAFSRISNGPVGGYTSTPNSASFADVDLDGDLDVVITSDLYSAGIYIYQSCTIGARLLPHSGCFACPAYMRRGGIIDVCYECAPDRITGGLPAEGGCQFDCPDGFQRPIGEDSCSICPAGYYWVNTINRNTDATTARCAATA